MHAIDTFLPALAKCLGRSISTHQLTSLPQVATEQLNLYRESSATPLEPPIDPETRNPSHLIGSVLPLTQG